MGTAKGENQEMKTFDKLREQLDASLYEMEMLTHKKKIAAAQSVLDKAKAAHSKASDTHFKLSDAARKKHGKDSPQERAHVNMAKMHKRAAQGDFGGSHGAATVRHGNSYDFHGKHVPEKHVDHAEKLHNNMVDAHHKLQAAKKASPLHKAKSAIHKFAKKVGIKEANIDEISDWELKEENQEMKSFKQLRESKIALSGSRAAYASMYEDIYKERENRANDHDEAAHFHHTLTDDDAHVTHEHGPVNKDALKHHEAAAKHHEAAASHYRIGNYDQADRHATKAGIHSQAAKKLGSKDSHYVHLDTKHLHNQKPLQHPTSIIGDPYKKRTRLGFDD